MIKLAIIGTNWIPTQFVEAARETKRYELTAVYSRTHEKAENFINDVHANSAQIFNNLDDFFASDVFDTVYIASPNSLHFGQALEAINSEKNVIIEKPAFSNKAEFDQIRLALQTHPNVFYFEAARHIYDPNFEVVEEKINNLDNINGATISYMKYSSRYDNVLAGEEPNVFSPKFSGGALQDLGVYTVYAAIKWFGMPESVQYFPTIIKTGVDGKGTAILKYPTFNVTLLFGKNAQSYIPTEIYAGKKTIWIDNIGTMDQVLYFGDYKSDKPEDLTVPHPKNPMVEEALAFATMINNHDFHQMHEFLDLSMQVNEVVYELRQSAGIKFAADDNE